MRKLAGATDHGEIRFMQGALWALQHLAGGEFEQRAIARYTFDEDPVIPDYMPGLTPSEEPY